MRGVREREFEYWVASGVVIEGIVSGRMLPPDGVIPAQVTDVRIDARVYFGESDADGLPLHGAGMTEELIKTAEAYAFSVLCEEEK